MLLIGTLPEGCTAESPPDVCARAVVMKETSPRLRIEKLDTAVFTSTAQSKT
jgi:hypothetical protein